MLPLEAPPGDRKKHLLPSPGSPFKREHRLQPGAVGTQTCPVLGVRDSGIGMPLTASAVSMDRHEVPHAAPPVASSHPDGVKLAQSTLCSNKEPCLPSSSAVCASSEPSRDQGTQRGPSEGGLALPGGGPSLMRSDPSGAAGHRRRLTRPFRVHRLFPRRMGAGSGKLPLRVEQGLVFAPGRWAGGQLPAERGTAWAPPHRGLARLRQTQEQMGCPGPPVTSQRTHRPSLHALHPHFEIAPLASNLRHPLLAMSARPGSFS